MTRILVATADGLHRFDEDGAVEPTELVGRSVNAVTAHASDRWAIVDRTTVWHAADGAWQQIGDLNGLTPTCLAVTDALLVGSSEAHLFRLTDASLDRLEAFDRAPGRQEWHTPWGGPPDTRSMSEWDDDVYVNVHVGGILRSDDRGDTWTPTIDIDADVHQVATADGLVLAACAGGLATSVDRGATWTVRADDLDAPYARAVAVCGDTVLLSASRGPRGGRAGVYRGDLHDGGFARCAAGLPESFEDNIDSYCLDAMPDGSLAAFGTGDGTVFASNDAGATWQLVASDLLGIEHVLLVP
jgi:hypothetical protein